MTSRWIKRIAIAIAAFVLLVAVAIGVLVATFDANRYKSVAIDWMQAKHRRTLSIDGPIELSFFPRLSVKVTNVRLSEQGSADEFAAIDDASLAVAVMPLLRKELVIGRVSMRGARANILRDAKGVRNIDDLLTPTTPASAEPNGPARPPLHFDVSGVQLDDVRLHVRDDLAKLAGDVALESFASGRLANQVPAPVKLRATAALTRPQALKLTVDGHATLLPDLDRNAIALADAQLAIDGETAAVKALSLTLEGAFAWDDAALHAGPMTARLKNATLNAASITNSSLSLKSALFRPAAQRLELDTLKIALAGQQAGNPFEFALDWPKLTVDPAQLAGSAFSGRVKLAGTTALAGDFRSAAPTGRFEALRIPGFMMSLSGSSGLRKIDATVAADVVVDASKAAVNVGRLDLAATFVDPGLQPLKIGAKGTATVDAAAAAWAIAGALNDNRFESRGRALWSGRVPRVNASARFDALDLGSLLTPAKAAAAAPPATATTAPDTPIALDALKTIDGEFSLDAESLVFHEYKVNDAKVAATLDGGLLRVSRLAGRTWGGAVDASGSADANTRRVALKLDASSVNINALLKDVADKDVLEGTGQVTADLSSIGATVGAMRSNLAGSVAAQLRDGAVKGINLARTFRQAQSALSLKQDTVSTGSAVEKTDFSELKVSARLANGVAESDDLDARSPFIRLGGAGRFDVGRGRIDYTAKASIIDSSAGQGGAGLESLKGVTVPVVLSGPFEAIIWKIQWSGIAAAAIRNQLKEKLTERLGATPGIAPGGAQGGSAPTKPKDLLKDKLKGLFR